MHQGSFPKFKLIYYFYFFIFVSRTLTYLDLECCNLTEYAGALFLSLFTKYPVKLEELYLDKNSSISDSTRKLIFECLNLKSRHNSISNEQPLSHRLSRNDDSTSINSIISEKARPVELRKKKKKSSLKEPSKIVVKEEIKSVGFDQIKKTEQPVQTKKEEEEEELFPVAIEPYGTVGRMLYWNRV